MALQNSGDKPESVDEWEKFFTDNLRVSQEVASVYASALLDNGYCWDTVKMVLQMNTPVAQPCPTLLQLGFKAGHCLKMSILLNTQVRGSERTQGSASKVKIPRPVLSLDINQVDYDQFCFEWRTYRNHYQLGRDDIPSHLFYCGNDDVRKRIRIECPMFTEAIHTEGELLKVLKSIVLSKVSKIVHVKQFCSLKQNRSESCSEFLVRLQTKASCCDFLCMSCNEPSTNERVKEQFIIGLANETIQTAVLKTESVNPGTSLDKLLSEALTLEQSIRDQVTLKHETPDLYSFETEVESQTSEENQVRALTKSFRKKVQVNGTCVGCGRKSHAAHERQSKCPAWGKKCFGCGKLNHFRKHCSSTNPSAQLLEMSCMVAEVGKSNYITVKIRPNVIGNSNNISKVLSAFADTGANICLLGPKQMSDLGVTDKDLVSCNARISVAGGTYITAVGKLGVTIALNGKKTTQTAYYSKKADRFFLNRQTCIDLGIVPSCFPQPYCANINCDNTSEEQPKPAVGRSGAPAKPHKIPFDPTEDNIPKLKKYLVDVFAQSAFNKSAPFPKLSTPPATIHLKPDHIVPKPAYWPATVAEHWAEEVKTSIEDDVKAGVLLKVPFNEPTVWCARMVLVKKKNGRPRRTVDYQQLNAQCLREPNYGESPFHTARRVPQDSWKSTFDAVDGYHSVELDEASSKLTTFVTPWGRYRYLRFPQGHCSAGDAFNGRVQHIIAHIPRLVRIVDDICVFDNSISEAFWHAWQVLTVSAENGIVVNQDKFQFCCRSVQFAGLAITTKGIQPSEKMLSAIEKFPPPTDISKARAFFGLVNQVQWAYANCNEMVPFRNLVKPNSSFAWTNELHNLFEQCKQRIIKQVHEGVRQYDINRSTCLQTDFSKDGLGYLLLQKYCQCSLDQAPLCCRDGWRLVFAGSRFTKGAEANYAPTEGEALAVAWALNHAHIFTKGCPRLIISTDHKPLLGILNDKPLNDIKNPRLLRLKEQTLAFDIVIKYNRGRWHRAPDALSRSPQSETSMLEITHMFLDEEADQPTVVDYEVELVAAGTTFNGSISLDEVRQATTMDPELQLLMSTVQKGFPSTHQLTDPAIRQYFNARDEIWIYEGLLMCKDRLIIPKSLRPTVLGILHSAHQGVEGMRARAAHTVYWPGLNSSIRNTRNSCKVCNEIAPSQAREPLRLLPQPSFPFQFICMDAFELHGHHYLAIVDKFSGWIIVFYVRSYPTRKHVISSLRSVFSTFGAPEILYTDGGLPFQAQELELFLKRWKVSHITSSAFYPQSNGRAELAVKTAKRLLTENTASDGSLNCEKACQALLQYRNTPIQHVGLSPAQLLFHRSLRDSLPIDPRSLHPSKLWLEAASKRENAFKERNIALSNRYNRNTRPLNVIPVGTWVLVQDADHKGRWSRSGVIVEVDGRNYFVRMDGSNRVISRNRKFLKPLPDSSQSDSLLLTPSTVQHDGPLEPAGNHMPIAVREDTVVQANPNNVSGNIQEVRDRAGPSNEEQSSEANPAKVHPMLKRLADHNKRGLRE